VRAPELRGSVRRLGAARSLLVLAFVGLAARGIHLTLIDPRGSERGIEQLRTTIALAPERGLILDRNGSELALTVKAPSLFAVPSKVADPAATARVLAKELGADARRIEAQLRRRGHFAYLARWVTPKQAERVRALALPGIEVMHEPRRVYPHRELAAHAVGFANIDGEGIRGVEEQENGFLRGQARKIPVERDARGRLMIGTAPDPDATAGGDLMLTLDATLQADAERALDAAIASTQSRAGLVVSLDPRSGEILALAERPTFDPNRFRDLHFPDTRSRAFLDAFEPGSTFKTFVISAALEAGAVDLEDRFDCENGRFPVPGKVIRDSHPHGVLSVAEVLQVSSNIGAAKIGYRLGAPALHSALRRFGFGRATGSGFPAESTGLLRHWKK
jgi:cell division protein FtsI (penicillin-binding protein 3)